MELGEYVGFMMWRDISLDYLEWRDVEMYSKADIIEMRNILRTQTHFVIEGQVAKQVRGKEQWS